MAQAAPSGPSLDSVLSQLDAASAKFHSAEADLKWDLFEKVVRDTTTQTGSIYFLRHGNATEMGAVITSPAKKYLHFANGRGDMYDAVTRQTTTFNAGQDKARAESFLTLGFGGSGKDLQRAWTIKMLGTENIGGVTVDKLDLVPKEQSVANMFTHITIWIDPARSVSLKQESFTPEGDTRTAYYTNIRYNQPVDTKTFAAPKH